MSASILSKTAAILVALTFSLNSSLAQDLFIPADSTASSILTYTFNGGALQSYGCEGFDPTYWMSGGNMSITVTFVNPQSDFSFRVWGMNDDDIAELSVDGSDYFLDNTSASYSDKVICNTEYGSPGPDGIVFSNGQIVGANTNSTGNYSYQDITLNTADVTTFTLSGIAGAGWGFIGVTVNTQVVGVTDPEALGSPQFFPNPAQDVLMIIPADANTSTQITLTDSQGRQVRRFTEPPSSRILLGLEDLEPGMYVATVIQDLKSHSEVIIIE